ncbi:MAG: dockerin type I repeat-containing protein [Patescibacteria group bacterium]
MSKQTLVSLALGVLTLLFLVGFYTFAVWNPPTAIPPGGNAPAPLNVSSSAQTKDGSLAVNIANIAANGFLVPYGRVGIGIASPAALLDIAGSIYVDGGSGDVTGDGITDVGDALWMEQYHAGLRALTRDELARGDIDGDGRTTRDDTFILMGLTVGVPKSETERIVHGAYGMKCTAFGGGICTQREFVVVENTNVGIGTNLPSKRLEVEGGGFLLENASGIADTGPLVSMAANSYSSPRGTFRLEDLRSLQADPSFVWNVADSSGTILAYNFQGGGTSRLAITQSGDIGIGVASPSQRLEVNGGVRLNTSTPKPLCTSAIRGTVWFTQGGAGVKDTLEVCAKNAGGVYAWRTLW